MAILRWRQQRSRNLAISRAGKYAPGKNRAVKYGSYQSQTPSAENSKKCDFFPGESGVVCQAPEVVKQFHTTWSLQNAKLYKYPRVLCLASFQLILKKKMLKTNLSESPRVPEDVLLTLEAQHYAQGSFLSAERYSPPKKGSAKMRVPTTS